VNKQISHRSHMERFILKKLNEIDCKENVVGLERGALSLVSTN
jgi:hypothetical protein